MNDDVAVAIRQLVTARLAERAQATGREDVIAAAVEAASLPAQVDSFRHLLAADDAPDGIRALLGRLARA